MAKMKPKRETVDDTHPSVRSVRQTVLSEPASVGVPEPSLSEQITARVQAIFGGDWPVVVAGPLGPMPTVWSATEPVAFKTREGWVLVAVVDGTLQVQR